MRDDQTCDLDTALRGLAAAVDATDPGPGPALRARVLDDAARVLQDRRRPALRIVASDPAPRRPGWRPRRGARGWAAQAGVAMAACLMVGFAIGYVMDDPMMDLDPLTPPGPVAAVELGDTLFAFDEAI